MLPHTIYKDVDDIDFTVENTEKILWFKFKDVQEEFERIMKFDVGSIKGAIQNQIDPNKITNSDIESMINYINEVETVMKKKLLEQTKKLIDVTAETKEFLKSFSK